jgi:hypothetical protein
MSSNNEIVEIKGIYYQRNHKENVCRLSFVQSTHHWESMVDELQNGEVKSHKGVGCYLGDNRCTYFHLPLSSVFLGVTALTINHRYYTVTYYINNYILAQQVRFQVRFILFYKFAVGG